MTYKKDWNLGGLVLKLMPYVYTMFIEQACFWGTINLSPFANELTLYSIDRSK